MRERQVIVLGLHVNEHRVTLVEGAALRVLSGKAHGIPIQEHGGERQRFGKTVIHRTLAVAHLRALFEEFGDFGVNVKSFGHANETFGDFREFFDREAGIYFVRAFITTMLIGRPIVRQFAQVRYFSKRARTVSAISDESMPVRSA